MKLIIVPFITIALVAFFILIGFSHNNDDDE
jgi:hypothetical protein